MISVCMACRNGEKFIRKQIESILCQLGNDDELVISDDDSSDSTLDVIKSLKDSRIRLLKHTPLSKKRKYGNGFYCATANFEEALMMAKGDIIFLSDHDDIWADNKVRVCLSVLEHYDFLLTNFYLIDENDNITNHKFLNCNPLAGGLLRTLLVAKMQGCTMAFKRCVLEKALPFPKNLMLHDAWIGLVAKRYFKTTYIDLPLIGYRRTGNNVSSSGGQSNNPFWFRIYYRMKILFQILIR